MQLAPAMRLGWAALLLVGLCACVSTPRQAKRLGDPELELAAARRATAEQRWDEAASRWHDIFLRADENSLEACAQTARALIELRDPQSAQKLVELGLRTYPTDALLYEIKGNALEAQGFRRAAETAYEHALDGGQVNKSARLSLASLRCDLELYEAALAILEPELHSDQAGAREYALAGEAYKALRRYDEAYTCFEKAFALEVPKPAQLVAAASMYADPSVRKKNARAAGMSRAWLERALRLDPQDTLGHLYLGQLAEDEQRDELAARCYRRAVETDPACMPALCALAEIESRRGNIELSQAIALRALELERDPERRAALEKLANPPAPEAPETPVEVEAPAAPPPSDG